MCVANALHMRAFVEIQVPRGEIPALYWSKNRKKTSLDTLEWSEGTLPESPPPHPTKAAQHRELEKKKAGDPSYQ